MLVQEPAGAGTWRGVKRAHPNEPKKNKTKRPVIVSSNTSSPGCCLLFELLK